MALPYLSRYRCGADGVEIEIENFFDDLLVGLVRGCLEEIAVAAPHCVHEEHRAEHPRRNGGVDLSEFTVAHTTLDDAGDQTQNALDDFATVKAREVGEVAQLRVNEAEQRGEIRRSEKAPIPAYELRERVRRRLLRGGGKLALGAPDLGDDGVANDC